MSEKEKEPSNFQVVYDAFGGWSPGGVCVNAEGHPPVEIAKDRFLPAKVLLLERANLERFSDWRERVDALNAGYSGGTVVEVRVVESIEDEMWARTPGGRPK